MLGRARGHSRGRPNTSPAVAVAAAWFAIYGISAMRQMGGFGPSPGRCGTQGRLESASDKLCRLVDMTRRP